MVKGGTVIPESGGLKIRHGESYVNDLLINNVQCACASFPNVSRTSDVLFVRLGPFFL